ncbi:winged helix-turn-helix domain-containing protein [Roseobacter sp. A03A-229]
MKWGFGNYVLDSRRAELSGPDGPVHIERQPLDVLVHLICNSDRVVSRDELIERVWNGRFVSDATVSTAIKQARKAVGDTGAAQDVIRTVHGRGFRFVAEAAEVGARPAKAAPAPSPARSFDAAGIGRPTLAVLRFQPLSHDRTATHLATAVPAELVSSLSRVHWLHMISRGSSFRFDPAEAEPQQIGAQLGVRYLVTGVVEVLGGQVSLGIELLATSDGALIWSDRFTADFADIQFGRSEIVSSIISALDLQIPKHEADASRHLSEAEFDAWSHYHLGLAHIFRFNSDNNLIAAKHFDAAIELDPSFSRAHSGKSFVHWQNAFMQFGDDRTALLARASEEAEIAISIDPNDPFAAFNCGRARWLEGDLGAGMMWLDRALRINPNSAQAHYNRGLLQVMEGVPSEGRAASEIALSLSPLDPLVYAMHSTQAMAAILEDDYETAARLAETAVQAPGAHFYIKMIAAVACALNGNQQSAERWRDRARAMRPDASSRMFFQAFPYGRTADRAKLERALRELGFT